MALGKYVIRNKLLRALDDACFEALWPATDLVSFVVGSQLAAQNERPRRVLFIESGFASIMASTSAKLRLRLSDRPPHDQHAQTTTTDRDVGTLPCGRCSRTERRRS